LKDLSDYGSNVRWAPLDRVDKAEKLYISYEEHPRPPLSNTDQYSVIVSCIRKKHEARIPQIRGASMAGLQSTVSGQSDKAEEI
jgi:hypothetical protein